MKKNVLVKVIIALFVFVASPVFAEVTLTDSDIVTVTRNVVDVTNPVVNTFTYSVVASEANPAAVTGLSGSFSIVFDGSENVSTNTATKTGAVSFDGVTFSKVGDYTFIVSETGSTNDSTYPVSDDQYYVYVSVRYDTDAMDGSMIATVLSQGKLNGEGEKTDLVYPSNSRFTSLTITHTVSGDMADVDKYFTVKVTVNGNDGDVYSVSGGSNASNPTTINANEETTFYLKHNEALEIGKSGELNQILIGTDYVVTQVQEDNYTTTIDSDTVLTVTKNTVTAPTGNETAINNDYRTSPITGLIISVMPFVLVIAISVVGIVLFTKKRND